MNQIYKSCILLTLIMLVKENLRAQQFSTNVNDFSIQQTILPGPNTNYQYEFQKGILSINKINLKWKNEQHIEKKKRIYRKRLPDIQIQTIDSILQKINIIGLDKSYSNPILDGVYWTFKFSSEGKEKEVLLDNCFLPKLNALIEYLNKQLPKKKRHIRFGILGEKKLPIKIHE